MVDCALLHTLKGGPDERFTQQETLIPLLRRLPTLVKARSMLQMKEQNQARKAGTPCLFHTTACDTTPPSGTTMMPLQPQPPPGRRPSPNYKGKNMVYWSSQQRSQASSSCSAPPVSSGPPAAPTTSPTTAPPWLGPMTRGPASCSLGPWLGPRHLHSALLLCTVGLGCLACVLPSGLLAGLLESWPPPHAESARYQLEGVGVN